MASKEEGENMPSYWADGVRQVLGTMAGLIVAVIAAVVYLIFRKR